MANRPAAPGGMPKLGIPSEAAGPKKVATEKNGESRGARSEGPKDSPKESFGPSESPSGEDAHNVG